jgi:heme-degrading monooxygenase HmoA
LEIVLIDTFIVPEESINEFLEQVRKSASLLRTLPGFVEGLVCEKTHGESPNNVVTTAVWQDEEAFQNAKTSAAEAFQADGLRPAGDHETTRRANEPGNLSPLALLRVQWLRRKSTLMF